MKPFSYIPDRLKPDKEKHVSHPVVFRALRHKTVEKEDFYPTCIEQEQRNRNMNNLFRDSEELESQSNYSVSLNTSLKSLCALFKLSGFRRNHEGVAKGFTSDKRGYSYAADKKGHVDYFLFDYINNNPCDDFQLVEEVSKDE